MELESLKKQLESIGEALVKELTNNLIKMDKVATGNLIRSLDYQVVDTINGLMLQIMSEPYLKNVDEGRKPNSTPPPVAAISNWVKVKNIKFQKYSDRQSAFVIARSIGRKGIVPTNVIKTSIDNIFKNKQKLIEMGIQDDVSNYIDKILK